MNIKKYANGWIYEINSPQWARGFVMTLEDACKRLFHFGGDATTIAALISSTNVKHIRHYQRERKGETQEGGES